MQEMTSIKMDEFPYALLKAGSPSEQTRDQNLIFHQRLRTHRMGPSCTATPLQCPGLPLRRYTRLPFLRYTGLPFPRCTGLPRLGVKTGQWGHPNPETGYPFTGVSDYTNVVFVSRQGNWNPRNSTANRATAPCGSHIGIRLIRGPGPRSGNAGRYTHSV